MDSSKDCLSEWVSVCVWVCVCVWACVSVWVSMSAGVFWRDSIVLLLSSNLMFIAIQSAVTTAENRKTNKSFANHRKEQFGNSWPALFVCCLCVCSFLFCFSFPFGFPTKTIMLTRTMHAVRVSDSLYSQSVQWRGVGQWDYWDTRRKEKGRWKKAEIRWSFSLFLCFSHFSLSQYSWWPHWWFIDQIEFPSRRKMDESAQIHADQSQMYYCLVLKIWTELRYSRTAKRQRFIALQQQERSASFLFCLPSLPFLYCCLVFTIRTELKQTRIASSQHVVAQHNRNSTASFLPSFLPCLPSLCFLISFLLLQLLSLQLIHIVSFPFLSFCLPFSHSWVLLIFAIHVLISWLIVPVASRSSLLGSIPLFFSVAFWLSFSASATSFAPTPYLLRMVSTSIVLFLQTSWMPITMT